MTTTERELPARTPLAAVADEAFDRIAELVRKVLHVPVGLVSLVDRDGQVFPGQAGLPDPWSVSRCTPLTHSFCQYVVHTARPLVVADARLDPVLQSNLAIADLGVVGYAGIPLVDLDGTVVGSLCAIDTQPHDWTNREIDLLSDLAAACSAELQLRSAAESAREAQHRASAFLNLSETLAEHVDHGRHFAGRQQALDRATRGGVRRDRHPRRRRRDARPTSTSVRCPDRWLTSTGQLP